MTTTDPREILRRADALRSEARQARKTVELLAPGVGLGMSIGTFQVDNYGRGHSPIRDVIREALTTFADAQDRAATELEASVKVVSR